MGKKGKGRRRGSAPGDGAARTYTQYRVTGPGFKLSSSPSVHVGPPPAAERRPNSPFVPSLVSEKRESPSQLKNSNKLSEIKTNKLSLPILDSLQADRMLDKSSPPTPSAQRSPQENDKNEKQYQVLSKSQKKRLRKKRKRESLSASSHATEERISNIETASEGGDVHVVSDSNPAQHKKRKMEVPKPTSYDKSKRTIEELPPSKKARNRGFSLRTLSANDIVALKEQKKGLMEFRKALPIFECRKQIVRECRQNDSVILIGETGSGKTTQIPQFLYEDFARKRPQSTKGIAITQPRRLAAVNVANRVAQEMGVQHGGLVGHHVRFDRTVSSETRITFLTDGMLLREAMIDPSLSRYHTIVLDEAHERSLQTDILLGLLKTLQRKRYEANGENGEKKKNNKLKLVIMSATLDASLFEEYFAAKVLYVAGRQFPVSVFYTPSPEQNYLDAMLITILQIHLEQESGDVLCFLTGRGEIESLEKLLNTKNKLLPENSDKLLPCPLFGSQDATVQQNAFLPTPKGSRKVVLATNIAETSVTVPSIRYVVDSGMVKSKLFDSKVGMDVLAVVPISLAQAKQRAGRAGRVAPGRCYRLYTEKTYLTLPPTSLPEIFRISLSQVILTLKSVGIENILTFDYIQKPPIESFRRSLSELFLLKALDKSQKLTELGKQMAMFPLDPMYAKALIESRVRHCSVEVISILAMLSVDNLLLSVNPVAKAGEKESALAAQQALAAFSSPYGDHIMFLNLYREYNAQPAKLKKEWCQRHLINFRTMKKVIDAHKQLTEYWLQLGWKLESSKDSDTENTYVAIRKSFTSAFISRVAFLSGGSTYQTILDQKKVKEQQVFLRKLTKCVLYNECVFTSKQYMRGILRVEREWILELQPEFSRRK